MNVPANVCGLGFCLSTPVAILIFLSRGIGPLTSALVIALGCCGLYIAGMLVGAADAKASQRQGVAEKDK